MTRARILHGLVFTITAFALVYGACVLPYRFPPQEFVVGASYELGFNNGISYGAYVLLVSLLTIVVVRILGEAKVPLERQPAQPSRLSALVAAAVIVGHVLLFTAVYLYKHRFVFGEGLYFQQAMYRMTLGDVPNVDFSFYYGPLMLYPGYWLSRLVGLDAAYGIWFVTTYVVGLLFLYGVVRYSVSNDRERAVWVAFLALGLFNPLTGLNETFTRFIFPTIVFLSVAAFLRRGGLGRSTGAIIALACAITYSFEAAVLSLGVVVGLTMLYMAPEALLIIRKVIAFAINSTMETGNQLTPFKPDRSEIFRRAAVLLVTGMALSIGFFLFIDPSGRALMSYPDIARSYSGGAHNIPIYPHFPFIALTAATVASLASLLFIVLRHRDDLMSASACVYAGLVLIAERAAFGAAEPSHFGYFGLPAFFVALFVVTANRITRMRAWLAGILLVGIVIPMQYYYAMEFVPFFTRRAQMTTTANASPTPVAAAQSVEQTLRQIVEKVGTGHAYVMHDLEYSSLLVYRDYHLKYPTYFTMLITARDPSGVQRSIDEIRQKHAIVIVPRDELHPAPASERRSNEVLRLLDRLSGAHTAGSDLNALLSSSYARLSAPLFEFLQAEYSPVYDDYGFVAFAPREN